MTDEEYRHAMGIASLTAQSLVAQRDDLEKISRTIGRAHAVSPILDPTGYRNGMQNLEEASHLIGPLLRAANELQPVIEELQARAGVPT